jgi:hypothetical protein
MFEATLYAQQVNAGSMTREEALRLLSKEYAASSIYSKVVGVFLKAIGR